jgi:uncharacterized MnhB-related membrane protein
MIYFNILIVIIMIMGALATAFTKNIMAAIIVFMVYSLMMAILWQQLNAPDLAITEASVGAGITSILFIVAYRKIRRMNK